MGDVNHHHVKSCDSRNKQFGNAIAVGTYCTFPI